jgi:hypothetical protein
MFILLLYIVYDGGLFVSLHREDIALISKPYPPGTQVEDVNPHTNTTWSGTVMDTPMDSNQSPHYLVQFDNGTSRSIRFADMPSLIPKPLVNVLDSAHLLPSFLKLNSKITFEHDGHYHKGSPNPLMGLIVSVTNHTSTRNKRIGGFLYQTYLWTGMNFAWKGSYSLVMYHHLFFVQLFHQQLSTP